MAARKRARWRFAPLGAVAAAVPHPQGCACGCVVVRSFPLSPQWMRGWSVVCGGAWRGDGGADLGAPGGAVRSRVVGGVRAAFAPQCAMFTLLPHTAHPNTREASWNESGRWIRCFHMPAFHSRWRPRAQGAAQCRGILGGPHCVHPPRHAPHTSRVQDMAHIRPQHARPRGPPESTPRP